MIRKARSSIRTVAHNPALAAAALALALGGCSSAPDILSGEGWFSRPLNFINPSPNAEARHQISDHRPLGPDEFVDAQGRCAGSTMAAEAAAATSGSAPQEAAAPAAPAIGVGVALEMSECEVVRRLGHPDRVEIGANERGERSAVLTYLRGSRPGIYRFVAGRLTVIEKAPEPGPQRSRQSRSARR